MRYKPFPKELLETEYVVNKMTLTEIGAKYGGSATWIHDRMREYGIPSRTSGPHGWTKETHWRWQGDVLSRINKTESGCWLWTTGVNTAGYGTIFYNGRNRLAHRVVWEMTNGPIPEGLHACHHCDNPPCVNPDHIFLGTQKDNLGDAARKNRVHSGTKNSKAIFDDTDIAAIRYFVGTRQISQWELARQWGVSQSAISNVVNERTYFK